MPADDVNRPLNGENALRACRDLLGLTQAAIPKQAGVKRDTVVEIEKAARRQGSIVCLRALANSLDVSCDDIAQ